MRTVRYGICGFLLPRQLGEGAPNDWTPRPASWYGEGPFTPRILDSRVWLTFLPLA
ncbi:hypothetical protein [Streptomyces sp. CA-179760]|uniref:hypothetical protein n=1 Tax=Streptomyces sp. CA-179760 TaxID=3240054 RepID=UPI003D910C54